MKKILILGVIGYGIYYFYNKSKETTDTATSTGKTREEMLTAIASKNLTTVDTYAQFSDAELEMIYTVDVVYGYTPDDMKASYLAMLQSHGWA